jgi:kynurenine formamidase
VKRVILLAAALGGCATAAPPDLLSSIRSAEVVDLTHVLDAASPYWPGSKYFPFECWDLAKFEEVRAFSRAYRVPEHYGTHVDAPVHFAEGQATIDAVPIARFIGPAVVFDIREKAARDPDAALTVEDVDAWEAVNGRIPEGAIALLLTGWGARWGDAEAYRNFDAGGTLRFPSYGLDAARRLLVERGCAGLGADVLSVDRGADEEFPVHRLGSGMGRWFAENLANLDRLPPAGAIVVVAPVPFRGGSGAQARAFALVPSRR